MRIGIGPATSIAIIMLCGSANADYRESRSAAPANNWSGLYVGVHAGHARTHSDFGYDLDQGTMPVYVQTYQNMIAETGPSGSHGAAFVGGLQLGYNVQSGETVFGLEVDFSSADIDDKRQRTFIHPSYPDYPFTHTQSISTDWIGTLRARLGVSYGPNAFLYATGGLALAEIKHAYSYDEPNLNFSSSARASDTKLGWVIGGGMEIALNTHWAIKAEYLRTQFSDVETPETRLVEQQPGANTAFRSSADLVVQTFRSGLSYRF